MLSARYPQYARHIILLSLMIVIMMILALTPANAQKRLALVVGNDDYENVVKLRKAVNDANGIGETLLELGFEVTTVTDVSRRNMNKALQTFTNSIEEGDIALFFYAGHGVEIDGENYLLPVDVPDARSDQLEFIKSETIRLNTLLFDLRAKKARLNLVILDACRNNPFSKSAGRSLGGAQGLARISAPQGTFVMYSADVGETALDRLSDSDENPNSIFTRTLIPLMKTPGIDLVDTAREARRQVRKLALSVSHEQTPAYYDAVLGDFYFTAATDETAPDEKAPIVTENKVKPVTPKTELALLEKPKNKSTSERLVPSLSDNSYIPALVVTAGEKDLIRLWDGDNMRLLSELRGEKKLISSVKLINKGRALLVAGKDGSVVSYSMPSFKKINALYPDFVVSVLGQANDGTIMVGGNNGILAAYNGESFEEIWRRQAHDGIISPILAVADTVVTASGDGAIVTTNVQSGRETGRVHTFTGGKITDIAFVNSATIVAVHEKGEIAYISLKTGQVLSSFRGHEGWISSVDITPDGSAVVTAGVNGLLKFWPVGGSAAIKSIPAHSDVASGAKFLNSSFGQKLASAGFDGVLRFWKDGGHKKLAELKHGPAILYFDQVSASGER